MNSVLLRPWFIGLFLLAVLLLATCYTACRFWEAEQVWVPTRSAEVMPGGDW